MQHEVGVRNLEILNSTTDAKGRKLEVVKVHVPPPLFRTYKEAAGVHVRARTPSINLLRI
jgi:agmatine deiminase